jgi:hypothetical protein
LNHGEIVPQFVHGGIVCVVEADEQVRIVRLDGKPAQDLSEGAGRQLGSSTSAVHELGKTDVHVVW